MHHKGVMFHNGLWLLHRGVMLWLMCVGRGAGGGALPDVCAWRVGACGARGQVCMYQAMHGCLCYNQYMYHRIKGKGRNTNLMYP